MFDEPKAGLEGLKLNPAARRFASAAANCIKARRSRLDVRNRCAMIDMGPRWVCLFVSSMASTYGGSVTFLADLVSDQLFAEVA